MDWKIIRAISEVSGKTLPYDDLKQLRQRMTEVAPHLVRYGDVEEPVAVKNASQLAQVILILFDSTIVSVGYLEC